MKIRKLSLKTNQILILLLCLSAIVAIFVDCQIIFNNSSLPTSPDPKATIRLNSDTLLLINDNQKSNISLEQNANIGRANPFAELP